MTQNAQHFLVNLFFFLQILHSRRYQNTLKVLKTRQQKCHGLNDKCEHVKKGKKSKKYKRKTLDPHNKSFGSGSHMDTDL